MNPLLFYVKIEVSLCGFAWYEFQDQRIGPTSTVLISLCELLPPPVPPVFGLGPQPKPGPLPGRLTLHNVVPGEGFVRFSVSGDWAPDDKQGFLTIPACAYMAIFEPSAVFPPALSTATTLLGGASCVYYDEGGPFGKRW